MINEINKILFEVWDAAPHKKSTKEVIGPALTAIYEIGLGVIGQDDNIDPMNNGVMVDMRAYSRNQLRDELRLAWAKACGVAEK